MGVQCGRKMGKAPLSHLLFFFSFFHFHLSRTDAQTCVGYDCLKEYVDLEDGAYSWSDTGHRLRVEPAASGRGGWTGYYLNLTSQRWHTLVVIVPDNLTTTDTTIMWMTDGNNEDDFAPDLSDYNMLVAGEIAAANGLVAAALFQVPNQPIVYAEDPDQSRRTEDSNRAFNRSLLHLAASDGQGRSKSSRHNREFPHIRRITRGDSSARPVSHPPHCDWCQQKRLGHLVGRVRRSQGDGHRARRHG